MSRCIQIVLPDGTKAIVRTAKRGYKPSAADIALIQAARAELLERQRRAQYCGGDPECNHEDDGEGTCLGCGAARS